MIDSDLAALGASPGLVYRFERKYQGEGYDHRLIATLLRIHPAFFREIYYVRQINSIYFDTPDLDCYTRHIAGADQRYKVRIRWYGDIFKVIDRPVLEIKIKKNLMGTKLRYELNRIEFKDSDWKGHVRRSIDSSGLPEFVSEILKAMRPVLLTGYHRQYFLSMDGSFRVTLDRQIEWFDMIHAGCLPKKRAGAAAAVIELKYGLDADDRVDLISEPLPFRLVNNSKYISGIQRLSGYWTS